VAEGGFCAQYTLETGRNKPPRKPMEDRYGHRISYLRISVTDRCNERCRYCMPQELQEWLPREGVMSYEEILRVASVGVGLGVRKVRVTGGEPLTRRDIVPFFDKLCAIDGLEDVGISTNGTLLANERSDGRTIAQALVEAGVRTANVSLDTLDAAAYAHATGRDYLDRALAGIDAALAAGFEKVKINSVLMRGSNEEQLIPLVDYANENGLLLRFIELMPVSTGDVLTEANFLPVAEARRTLEEAYGKLEARPEFRTNGPASYFSVPGREQLIGFIGAMTNLHFCDSCNKLRLTCDGKLRPCLGSHLEFDLLPEIRRGADDEEIAAFIRNVVDRKPQEHEFRDNYQPGRKMVAIGG
jgi:cyclic pyranopterin phosphate synthase